MKMSMPVGDLPVASGMAMSAPQNKRSKSASMCNSPPINSQAVVQVRKEKGKQFGTDGVFLHFFVIAFF